MVEMKELTKGRKGQSAIEYLSTYGWALLAIVIVGAVLLQMGIFDQCNKMQPMFTGELLDINDWDFVGEDEISIEIVAIDDTVEVTEIEIDFGDEEVNWEDTEGVTINQGETEVINIDIEDNDLGSGTCASGDIDITYNAGEIDGRIAVGDGQLQGRVP